MGFSGPATPSFRMRTTAPEVREKAPSSKRLIVTTCSDRILSFGNRGIHPAANAFRTCIEEA